MAKRERLTVDTMMENLRDVYRLLVGVPIEQVQIALLMTKTATEVVVRLETDPTDGPAPPVLKFPEPWNIAGALQFATSTFADRLQAKRAADVRELDAALGKSSKITRVLKKRNGGSK